jgi:hypothetical protein
MDIDDTIVLSDLLRSGEAPRLRRGAMRIDHSTNTEDVGGDRRRSYGDGAGVRLQVWAPVMVVVVAAGGEELVVRGMVAGAEEAVKATSKTSTNHSSSPLYRLRGHDVQ